MYPYFNNRWNIEYSTRYVSGPNPEPVTIDDVYKALQIDASNAFDAGDLMASARAARIEAEGILNQKIGPQVWDIIVDFWPVNWCLPLQPVSAINGIYWLDWNGTEHTVDPNIYAFYPAMNRLWLKPGYFWPDGEILPAGAIRIQVTVGIPLVKITDNVKKAILLRTGTLASIREDMTVGTVEQAAKVGTFEALLGATREFGV
jgi:hypothetical protein